MRALVVANGEPPSQALLAELAAAVSLVVGADGGGDVAVAAGIEPDFVAGDLDSVSQPVRERLGPTRLVHDPDPDRTDMQKAIEFAIERGAEEIDVAAFGGARADHALANLSVLLIYRGRCRLRLVDDLFEISLVESEAIIDAEPGTVVSLVALGQCEGVTTEGLRWDLEDHSLTFSPYGVHNEVRARPATVRIRSGDLLLFRGRFIEHHS